MKLRGERLARDLERLAAFGRDPEGGWTRPALSLADAQARAYVRAEMLAMGLAVGHDEVGNLIGRRRGARDDAPVVTGSHLDTVPRGGRFDGPLGVAGALEAVRALDEAGVTTGRPIEVVVFTGEEGSRFPRGTRSESACPPRLEPPIPRMRISLVSRESAAAMSAAALRSSLRSRLAKSSSGSCINARSRAAASISAASYTVADGAPSPFSASSIETR